MVTLKDIAREANVSIATVSRYLSNKISVRSETEQNILTAIDRLNYVPNVVAKSLKFNRTSNIALILPKINNLYYSEMTSGINTVLAKHGFNLFIFEVDHTNKSEAEILQTLRENMIAGAIFIGLSYDRSFFESIHLLQNNDIPVVYLNRPMDYGNIPLCYPNFASCGTLAAEHLISRGKRRLALVHALPDKNLLDLHTKAFTSPVLNAGLQSPLILRSIQGLLPSPDCLEELRRADVDGIFVLNELMAAGFVRAFREIGRTIPNDIAVLSFGNSLTAEITMPTLSCIDLQNYELGVRSAEMILSQILGKEFNPVTVLEPHVIQRQST